MKANTHVQYCIAEESSADVFLGLISLLTFYLILNGVHNDVIIALGAVDNAAIWSCSSV